VNTLAQKYAEEIEKTIAKYPPEQKQSAVMTLLYLAQRDDGYVTKQDINEISEILEMTPTEVVTLVGFYTLYHDEPGGKYRIQVCNDLPCALRGADEFLENLCQNLGIKIGETSEDGLVTVEAVMCLAGCDKAPLFQVQTGEEIAYHEEMSVESTMALIESWRKKEAQ
jgi:NADH-quinone oxidoreductase subunit E